MLSGRLGVASVLRLLRRRLLVSAVLWLRWRSTISSVLRLTVALLLRAALCQSLGAAIGHGKVLTDTAAGEDILRTVAAEAAVALGRSLPGYGVLGRDSTTCLRENIEVKSRIDKRCDR